jgi:hypothetical protein
VSAYSDNLWAEEMGIDLDELQKEHPLNRDQLKQHLIISKRAAEYWAVDRKLARLEYIPEAILDPPVVPVEKTVVKRAKVGRYDFTDAQLEIARRSLNAKDSM